MDISIGSFLIGIVIGALFTIAIFGLVSIIYDTRSDDKIIKILEQYNKQLDKEPKRIEHKDFLRIDNDE